jgi:hypothetical protein
MKGIKFDHFVFNNDGTSITEDQHTQLLNRWIEVVESMDMMTGGGSKLMDETEMEDMQDV